MWISKSLQLPSLMKLFYLWVFEKHCCHARRKPDLTWADLPAWHALENSSKQIDNEVAWNDMPREHVNRNPKRYSKPYYHESPLNSDATSEEKPWVGVHLSGSPALTQIKSVGWGGLRKLLPRQGLNPPAGHTALGCKCPPLQLAQPSLCWMHIIVVFAATTVRTGYLTFTIWLGLSSRSQFETNVFSSKTWRARRDGSRAFAKPHLSSPSTSCLLDTPVPWWPGSVSFEYQ